MSILVDDSNKTACRAAEAGLQQKNCAALVRPAGTGKGCIVWELLDAHPEMRVLWVVSCAARLELRRALTKRLGRTLGGRVRLMSCEQLAVQNQQIQALTAQIAEKDAELDTKLFRLSRKKAIAEETAAHPKRRNYDYVGIIGIEKLDKKLPMTCITVDAEDGLFCVGKDCVVTHNTMLAKAVAYESGMNCVNLNLNQIMDKWVGSSERN
ncbi:MAG: hypothetical protein EGQ70_05250, partial [Faecalibacterium prausnitzii]|nr:hypothetical protein [Faecalibacterium prausnitzii]